MLYKVGWLEEYRFFRFLQSCANNRESSRDNATHLSIARSLAIYLDALYPGIGFIQISERFNKGRDYNGRTPPIGGTKIKTGGTILKKYQIFVLLEGEHIGKRAIFIRNHNTDKSMYIVLVEGIGIAPVPKEISVEYLI